MIKYNNNTINDWNFGDDNIIKVYKHGAVCYYKVSSTSPTAQTPCYAVVNDISQYSDTEFEDVFNLADEKWYKLNNLNQYEEYGIYGSGRTITYYDEKLTIDTETPPSRLPQGYTEVEYIENTSTAYINLGVNPYSANGNSFIVESTFSSFAQSSLAYLISSECTTSPYYGFILRWSNNNLLLDGGSIGIDTTATNIPRVDGTSAITFYSDSTTTSNCNTPITLFCGMNGSSPWRNGKGKCYSFKLTINNNIVRDLVPAKRDSDNKYGMYDIVNDVFYISPNNVDFSGGEPIAHTKTYEYMYSGGSWVNLGEVSGSTSQTVWFDPPSSGDNAKFDIGHYWGENYKMVYRMYLQGSYTGDKGSFWQNDNKTPIEFHLYSNGYYYDMHNPTSTTSPSVNTSDYDYRILRQRVFNNYENSQVMDVTLTYGSVKIELVDSGTVIENTGSTRTGFNWYDGLYTPSIQSNSNQKAHISSIQVYNANNELVNDLKFVKNNGVTGSQEISMYDSVLNVTYNNTNSNTPTYHIVEDGGTTVIYPMYYDEIQDPPNNLSFSSMTEAEAYECPWVGMTATIDGDKYVFSGDSQSGYEWVYNPSRLPIGYTEVEYIENTGTSYLNIDFKPNTNTRILTEMQAVSSANYPRLFGAGMWNAAAGINLAYQPDGGSNNLHINWYGRTSWSYYTSFTFDYNKHTYDLNKNYLYRDETLVGSTSYTTSYQSTDNLGVFTYISGGRPSQSGYWGQEHFKGKMFSFKVYDNGTLVRDLVPCTRDNDNEVGAYDLVNDVFYTVPTGYTTDKLVAGNPV